MLAGKRLLLAGNHIFELVRLRDDFVIAYDQRVTRLELVGDFEEALQFAIGAYLNRNIEPADAGREDRTVPQGRFPQGSDVKVEGLG